jgi:hypothetical protein
MGESTHNTRSKGVLQHVSHFWCESLGVVIKSVWGGGNDRRVLMTFQVHCNFESNTIFRASRHVLCKSIFVTWRDSILKFSLST